jgi:hypothetical protein
MQCPGIAFVLAFATATICAPLPKRHEIQNGMTLTITEDEFGRECHDPLGRLMVLDGDTWVHAIADPATGGYRYGDPDIDLPDSVYLREDPVIAARRRAFHDRASAIVPVSGEVRLTVIPVWSHAQGQPAPDPANYWLPSINGIPSVLQAQEIHDRIFQADLAPFVNETGYAVGGSIADWWTWNSEGASSLVPDTLRHPMAANDSLPGFVFDPDTGLPFVLTGMEDDIAFWNRLAEAGVDIRFDPMRPIVILDRAAYSGRGYYEGYTVCPLVLGDCPLPTGVIAHELGHAVLQLPDTYTTDSGISQATDYQIMNYGCYGFSDTATGRIDPGYPADISAPFRHLLGWGETRQVQPGDTLDFTQHPRRIHWVANPSDSRERLYFRSWDPDTGFMQHYAPTAGYTLVEQAIYLPGSWRFYCKPRPWLLQAGIGLDSWPQQGQQVLEMDHWHDGSWFPWLASFLDSTGAGRVVLQPRDPDGLHLVLADNPLCREIPAGSEDVSLSLLNQGRALGGYRILVHGLPFESPEAVPAGGVIPFFVPQTVWSGHQPGDRLSIPIEIGSGGQSLHVATIEPIVGLDPSGLEIPIGSPGALIRSCRDHLVIAHGDTVRIYRDGLEFALARMPGDVLEAYPLDDRLLVIGDTWCSLVDLPSGAAFDGWPVYFPGTIEQTMVADLPGLGESLVMAGQDRLRGISVANPRAGYTLSLDMPDGQSPLLGMAYAGGDPADSAGFLPSRFCLVGGPLANRMTVLGMDGQVLHQQFLTEDSRFRHPVAADLLGNGYYEFAVPSFRYMESVAQQCVDLVSYSAGSGAFGSGVLPLGSPNFGMDAGIEFLVPIRSTTGQPHHNLVANEFSHYSNSLTRLIALDLADTPPRVSQIAGGSSRRRWLHVAELNSDDIPDLLRIDRGEGMHFMLGTDGLDFQPVSADGSLVHICEELQQEPVFWLVDGDLQAGFVHDGVLRFYNSRISDLPDWIHSHGPGNSGLHHIPGGMSGLRPAAPRLVIAWQAERLVLRIQPSGDVESCRRVRLDFSPDQESWQTLAELDWDGLSTLEWSSREHLGLHRGFFRAVSLHGFLDGSTLWTQP